MIRARIWGRREVGGVCLQLPLLGSTDVTAYEWLWSERDGGDRTRQEALADWAGASLRGRWVGRMAGQ